MYRSQRALGHQPAEPQRDHTHPAQRDAALGEQRVQGGLADLLLLLAEQFGVLQFLTESLLLAALGGAGGAVLGIAVTGGYAAAQGWPSVVPAWASVGGVAVTVVIGVLAGSYPAWRAARLSPTEAPA